jgi:hypothetical protein
LREHGIPSAEWAISTLGRFRAAPGSGPTRALRRSGACAQLELVRRYLSRHPEVRASAAREPRRMIGQASRYWPSPFEGRLRRPPQGDGSRFSRRSSWPGLSRPSTC